jgi:hypothetical protein
MNTPHFILRTLTHEINNDEPDSKDFLKSEKD